MTTDEAATVLRRAWAHVEGEAAAPMQVRAREHRGEWLAWVDYGDRVDTGRDVRARRRAIAASDARVWWWDRPRRAKVAEAEAILRGLLARHAAEVAP